MRQCPICKEQLTKKGTSWVCEECEENAIHMLDKAIDMSIENRRIDEMMSQRKNGSPTDENELAEAYMNRGKGYRFISEYKKAVEDFDRGIDIIERFYKTGVTDGSALSDAYIARGRAYDSMHKYRKAIRDYSRCIQIKELLKNAVKQFNEEGLDEVYLARADCYHLSFRYRKALKDYNRCIEISERLNRVGHAMDEDDLAWAYEWRGMTHYSLKRYKEAIKDYIRALNILKKMFDGNCALQDRYFGCLKRVILLIEKTNDRALLEDVIRTYLHPLVPLEKTDKATAMQNKIIEHLADGVYKFSYFDRVLSDIR